MKTLTTIASAAALVASVCACSGMSDSEKAMVGKYYIPALSDTTPLMELNADGTSLVRAFKPGEISFCVNGKWKIENDSLIIDNDQSTITIEDGDPALVGTVAPRLAYPIILFDETTLRIKRSGVIYDYHRRSN